MNEQVVKEISRDLNIKESQVTSTLNLLQEGNTIPFIARYRKEVTGGLDEEVIRAIGDVYEYQVNLLKRKEDVIRLIDEKGLMTDELKTQIMNAVKLVEVEDLYRPYKEKKKTKATDAIKNGLEPLAKLIMTFPSSGDVESITSKFITDKVKSSEEAMTGAGYIIAEWISDDAAFRKWIRSYTFRTGRIESKLKKGANDEKRVYEMYYEYAEDVRSMKPHRYLALNRGENEKILTVSLDVDKEQILEYLEEQNVKNKNSFVYDYVIGAIEDSYKRLIEPSIEREIRRELFELAEEVAIDVFAKNLEKLLLTPPMKEKTVLGFDPAYRTGCKLAVLDKTGKPLGIKVIYPHEPKNEYEKSKKAILNIIEKCDIDIIAIGNGTASRESETFIADVIKDANKKVEYIIVNEAGASVYSASKLAISEFPNLAVEERSAISIGRRLQDPLSELVKIDTKSIGVGQYQHDVSAKKLNESLDFVVSKSVNLVGVNINTASSSILSYVSGLNKKAIDNIIEHRNTKGKFANRKEVKKVKSLGDKSYEQAIGFIRITEGTEPLDQTSIHPESYDKTLKLLELIGLSTADLGSSGLIEALDRTNINELKDKLDIDIYTLEDIIKSLKQPLRDPRDEQPKPLLKSDILQIEDLKSGMKLQGTVRNVVDFGVFIDIGLKNDGLAHISKLTDRYIKHPMEVVAVGDIVDCYVENIFLDKGKVALTLLDPRS
ncbi:MAG: RNA-binding transcriptional accessory protein [Oscillospiraceae bacterium]|nr:RNA-binding transcriptional accessory protein [Oscillospiraceae bacterium]